MEKTKDGTNQCSKNNNCTCIDFTESTFDTESNDYKETQQTMEPGTIFFATTFMINLS